MNRTNEMETGEMKAIVDTLAHNWWLLALRGFAAVIFGLVAFIRPEITMLGLVILFGAFALVNGVLSLALATKVPKGYPKFGSLILGGIFGIIAGILTLVWPG
jgi:uncharacterized membrane protein HdeD (DUF308 family)